MPPLPSKSATILVSIGAPHEEASWPAKPVPRGDPPFAGAGGDDHVRLAIAIPVNDERATRHRLPRIQDETRPRDIEAAGSPRHACGDRVAADDAHGVGVPAPPKSTATFRMICPERVVASTRKSGWSGSLLIRGLLPAVRIGASGVDGDDAIVVVGIGRGGRDRARLSERRVHGARLRESLDRRVAHDDDLVVPSETATPPGNANE